MRRIVLISLLLATSALAAPAKGTLQGVASGAPAGLKIVVTPAGGGKAQKTQVGKGGAFKLKLAPGHYLLAIEDPKGLWGASAEADVVSGATVDVPLVPIQGARVEVQLKDRIGRSPRPPVASLLKCEEGGPAENAPSAKAMAVKGRVRHDAAPAGKRCKLRMTVTSLPLERILGPFDLEPGKTVKLPIHKIPWL